MFNNFFFLSEYLSVYEIVWKNMVESRQATGDNIIRRMRFECWITAAALNTQLEYVNTGWFKYDPDYFCVNKSQFVPVIFERPCT